MSDPPARLRVRVQPRARANSVRGLAGDVLSVSLTAPPVDGEANAALVAFLADLLDVAKGSLVLAGGHRGRNKLLLVAGLTQGELDRRVRAAYAARAARAATGGQA